jgi:hypothetical protein
MIEYLIELKGLTYQEILKDNVKEDDAWHEMTEKYHSAISSGKSSIQEYPKAADM